MKKIKTKLNKPGFKLINSAFLALLLIPVFALAAQINEDNVVSLVNQSREKENLNPLYINYQLSQIASFKAQDMIANHYFSHNSPNGLTPWYWFEKENYDYKYAGENLAINYDSAEEEHQAWMKSLTHRKNILNPNFTEIGIATASGIIDGKNSSITVQIFAAPQIGSLSVNSDYKIIPDQKQLQTFRPTQPIKTDSSQFDFQENTWVKNIQKQSPAIIWLITLLVSAIIFRDILKEKFSRLNINYKFSMANLILFVVLYSLLF